MEGGWFAKLGSRLSAAHIRLKGFQELQGWRAARFQNLVLAVAPRTFVLKVSNSYRDGGGFQNWALAVAPRTFVLKVSNNYRDGGRFLFKMRLSPWRRARS